MRCRQPGAVAGALLVMILILAACAGPAASIQTLPAQAPVPAQTPAPSDAKAVGELQGVDFNPNNFRQFGHHQQRVAAPDPGDALRVRGEGARR